MLQATARRFAALEGRGGPIMVCNDERRFAMAEQPATIGVSRSAVVLEPVGRNTAPAIAATVRGLQGRVHLGYIDARHDWGHASDYVEDIWHIVNHDTPDDFALATGEVHSVREFVEPAFEEVGIEIVWEGERASEKGRDAATGAVRIEIAPGYFHPVEVDVLIGDAAKGRAALGWVPRCSFKELVSKMAEADLDTVRGKHRRSRRHG